MHWTPAQACTELGVCRTTLYKMLANGTIKRLKTKGVRRTFIDADQARGAFSEVTGASTESDSGLQTGEAV